MTFAHGQFNPNPFANPFNTRVGKVGIQPCKNPRALQVPNQDVPLYGTPEWNQRYAPKRLEVPNQDIPLGDQLRGNGFLGNSDRLFRLADGTLVDFKTRKVIWSPNKEGSDHWGNPCQEISFGGGSPGCGSWNDTTGPKLEQLINKIDDYYGRAVYFDNGDLDQDSIDYWLHAEQEAETLKSKMTDAQRAAIASFEQHFPKSKLIEESKKCRKILVKGKQIDGKCDPRANRCSREQSSTSERDGCKSR